MGSRSGKSRGERDGFERHFEGAQVLDGLLELVNTGLDSNEVLARFVAGHQEGASSSDVIPTLFDGEPRFPDPEIARKLYQNLLGLWDLVASGRTVELNPTQRPAREKKKKPEPPPPWDPSAGPDAAFVEAAWRYLEDLPEGDPRALERLNHAFENRQDALLQWLDEAGLEDDTYATVRFLLFEIFGMLELGGGAPVPAVSRKALEVDASPAATGDVPPALRAYADEALTESDLEQDAQLRSLVDRGVAALWRARADKLS